MQLTDIEDLDRLKRINEALMERVEKSMDQQGNAFSLFQTALNLDGQVRRRTDELSNALRNLEVSNTELAKAKEFAEQANISKTRFLAAASHDVLQPLQAAQLSISALNELQETREGVKLVNQMQNAMDTMSDLLRTLLEISKLDAGVMQPQIELISLQEVFKSLRSDFLPIAKAKNLTLRFRKTDHIILSDRHMFRRILQNLISNALRYTQTGGVLVGARLRRKNTVYIEVFDTGIGIDEDQYDAIFDEFHRSYSPNTHADEQEPGLGLGLSIVHRMVKSLNHDLKLSSKHNRGSSFKIGVRKSHTHFPEQQPAVEKKLTGLRTLNNKQVVIVENDVNVLEAMKKLIKSWGCEILSARSKSECLAKIDDTILDGKPTFKPDFILADQHLDFGELGIDTINQLRDDFNKPIPALLVTADMSEQLIQQAKAVDIELLSKPLKPIQLRNIMNHLTK
jgi:signal transduction histidine kinase